MTSEITKARQRLEQLRRAAARAEVGKPSRIIAARFAGECPHCGESFDAGTHIGKVGAEWRCATCITEATP